jgi:hypothetical protein
MVDPKQEEEEENEVTKTKNKKQIQTKTTTNTNKNTNTTTKHTQHKKTRKQLHTNKLTQKSNTLVYLMFVVFCCVFCALCFCVFVLCCLFCPAFCTTFAGGRGPLHASGEGSVPGGGAGGGRRRGRHCAAGRGPTRSSPSQQGAHSRHALPATSRVGPGMCRNKLQSVCQERLVTRGFLLTELSLEAAALEILQRRCGRWVGRVTALLLEEVVASNSTHLMWGDDNLLHARPKEHNQR